MLVLSIVATALLIIGSFVTYAEPISSTEMQNIYLHRITRFGVAILLLQIAAIITLLTPRQPNAV